MNAPSISVKQVPDALPAGSRERSVAKAASYFAVSAAIYSVSFALVAYPDAWWARVALALLNGLAVGMLFIVGHDACHGSLTPKSGVNKWLGRLAFLPSLHPFAAWE